MRHTLFIIIIYCFIMNPVLAQENRGETLTRAEIKKQDTVKIIYGTASYYANKFQGRKTANGEIFNQQKLTAACNVLPLGTWIRVTNLKNKSTVVVKVNDRLHGRMKRAVDLSREAARQLGFLNAGLAKVKVEVLEK